MQAIILSSNTAIRARVITVRTSAREIDGNSCGLVDYGLWSGLAS